MRLSSLARSARTRLRLRRTARFLRASERDLADWYADWHAESPYDEGADLELYLLVRGLRPGRIVETGVNRGRSSAAMLRALAHSGNGGTLTSIDLPTRDPMGRLNAGGEHDAAWLRPDGTTGCEIPEYLKSETQLRILGKSAPVEVLAAQPLGPGTEASYSESTFHCEPVRVSRWTLIVGDARVELPRIAPGYDLFFHDSDHSYGHQAFEYAEAAAALAPGGVLASDDIRWRSPPHAWDVLFGREPRFEWPPFERLRGALRRVSR